MRWTPVVWHHWLHSFQFRSYWRRVDWANEASCSLVIRVLGMGRICMRVEELLGQVFESKIWKMTSKLKLTEWKSWIENHDPPYNSMTQVSAHRTDVAGIWLASVRVFGVAVKLACWG